MINYDKDFIYLCSENARMKLKELSHILKKSQQRLKYTLKNLELEKTIHSPHCVFDYSYFGLILFRVYFKGGYINEKDKSDIIKKLSENPYIVSIYEMSGEFDLVIEISSPNPSRFNKELKKIADLIPSLNNYKVILNLVTHLYPKSYLIKNPTFMHHTEQEIIVGGDRTITDFNLKEMKVMESLLLHPKSRYTKLAELSDMNVKTMMSVMRSLKTKKIIKGFKYVVDTNQLKINKFRLFLKLHNISQERETELLDFMLKTKEVVQLHKTVGDWDMEIDVESLDKSSIRLLTSQIRDQFKDLIETFNITEYYDCYMRLYLPRFLFNKESTTITPTK